MFICVGVTSVFAPCQVSHREELHDDSCRRAFEAFANIWASDCNSCPDCLEFIPFEDEPRVVRVHVAGAVGAGFDCVSGRVDDDGRVVDALTKPIVLHAVGTVVRVVDLGYKRREIKATPVELKLTAVIRKELRIITVRVQTDKGEAVARSAI